MADYQDKLTTYLKAMLAVKCTVYCNLFIKHIYIQTNEF